MNFEKLAGEILSVDNEIRYVRFIDDKGGLIFDKIKEGKILLQDQEGLGKFSVELPIMKQMQQIFDESLGKARFMHIIRDKVHQFIYYIDSVIIYTTCEPNTDPHRIREIIIKIDTILCNLPKPYR